MLEASSMLLLAGRLSLLQAASATVEVFEHWLCVSATDALGGEAAVVTVVACRVTASAVVVAGAAAAAIEGRSFTLADTGLLPLDWTAWLTVASTPPHENIDSVAWAKMSAASGGNSLLLVLLTPSVL